MRKKLLGVGLLVAVLCLMTACSSGTARAGSASASQPSPTESYSSAVSSASDQASTSSVTPSKTESSSAGADASTSASTSSSKKTSDKTKSSASSKTKSKAQKNTKTEGKPMLTGSFASDAKLADESTDGDDGKIQTWNADNATIITARFATSHATEAYMDQYSGGDFDVVEKVTVAGTKGTHYRWKTGDNEDKAVVDAVVTESGGYSLLFLTKESEDTFKGMTDAGPTEKVVEAWIASLTVTTKQ